MTTAQLLAQVRLLGSTVLASRRDGEPLWALVERADQLITGQHVLVPAGTCLEVVQPTDALDEDTSLGFHLTSDTVRVLAAAGAGLVVTQTSEDPRARRGIEGAAVPEVTFRATHETIADLATVAGAGDRGWKIGEPRRVGRGAYEFSSWSLDEPAPGSTTSAVKVLGRRMRERHEDLARLHELGCDTALNTIQVIARGGTDEFEVPADLMAHLADLGAAIDVDQYLAFAPGAEESS